MAKLMWITPNAEQMISDMARVSAPENQGKTPGQLMKYLISHEHWSPFEMANACFEIDTTRDIARQILRHRSFSFQEFSQRYATVDKLPLAPLREARMQDTKNRQNSIETDDVGLQEWWEYKQTMLRADSMATYTAALERGIAKEVARAVLPEGLTSSRMYMNGTIRSWMHFCKLRSGNGTQKETQEITQSISSVLEKEFPQSWNTLMGE